MGRKRGLGQKRSTRKRPSDSECSGLDVTDDVVIIDDPQLLRSPSPVKCEEKHENVQTRSTLSTQDSFVSPKFTNLRGTRLRESVDDDLLLSQRTEHDFEVGWNSSSPHSGYRAGKGVDITDVLRKQCKQKKSSQESTAKEGGNSPGTNSLWLVSSPGPCHMQQCRPVRLPRGRPTGVKSAANCKDLLMRLAAAVDKGKSSSAKQQAPAPTSSTPVRRSERLNQKSSEDEESEEDLGDVSALPLFSDEDIDLIPTNNAVSPVPMADTETTAISPAPNPATTSPAPNPAATTSPASVPTPETPRTHRIQNKSMDDLWTDEEFDSDSFLAATQQLFDTSPSALLKKKLMDVVSEDIKNCDTNSGGKRKQEDLGAEPSAKQGRFAGSAPLKTSFRPPSETAQSEETRTSRRSPFRSYYNTKTTDLKQRPNGAGSEMSVDYTVLKEQNQSKSVEVKQPEPRKTGLSLKKTGVEPVQQKQWVPQTKKLSTANFRKPAPVPTLSSSKNETLTSNGVKKPAESQIAKSSVSKTSTVSSAPRTSTVSSVSRTSTVSSAPRTSTVSSVSRTSTVSSVPKTSTVSSVPRTSTITSGNVAKQSTIVKSSVNDAVAVPSPFLPVAVPSSGCPPSVDAADPQACIPDDLLSMLAEPDDVLDSQEQRKQQISGGVSDGLSDGEDEDSDLVPEDALLAILEAAENEAASQQPPSSLSGTQCPPPLTQGPFRPVMHSTQQNASVSHLPPSYVQQPTTDRKFQQPPSNPPNNSGSSFKRPPNTGFKQPVPPTSCSSVKQPVPPTSSGSSFKKPVPPTSGSSFKQPVPPTSGSSFKQPVPPSSSGSSFKQPLTFTSSSSSLKKPVPPPTSVSSINPHPKSPSPSLNSPAPPPTSTGSSAKTPYPPPKSASPSLNSPAPPPTSSGSSIKTPPARASLLQQASSYMAAATKEKSQNNTFSSSPNSTTLSELNQSQCSRDQIERKRLEALQKRKNRLKLGSKKS